MFFSSCSNLRVITQKISSRDTPGRTLWRRAAGGADGGLDGGLVPPGPGVLTADLLADSDGCAGLCALGGLERRPLLQLEVSCRLGAGRSCFLGRRSSRSASTPRLSIPRRLADGGLDGGLDGVQTGVVSRSAVDAWSVSLYPLPTNSE